MRNQKELRYFLYARKSSESEDRQMASINDQIAEVKKIAKELGINVIASFTESKSAKAPGRDVFNQMLLGIEKGEADAIVCWKLNRLARNPVDGGKISWMLQNNIIKHIQCFGRDYRPTDNVLMMQVELGMANQFVKDLSVDVKRGMRQKAERGWCPFPTLPMGYIHHKDRKGVVQKEEIIKDKERFPIVRKLWELMLTGAYCIADIKREGDRRGLVNFNKRPYCIHTYHKLFSTEFYYGYFYWNDSKGNKKKYKGLHKTMVTEKEFDMVQSFIGNFKRATRAKKYNFTFRGLLTCGECGCNITAERKFQVRCKNCRFKFSCINRNDCPKCNTLISDMDNPTIIDITYYRCTKRKGKCSQKTVTEDNLEKQYLEALREIEIPKEFYEIVCQELEIAEKNANSNELKVIQQLKKRKSELDNRIGGLAIMRADGDIDREQYNQLKNKAISEIRSFDKEIKEAEKGFRDWVKIAKGFVNFSLNATKTLKEVDGFTKKALLLKLGSNQRLMGRKLHFIRAKPLLAIKECHSVYKAEKDTFEPKNSLVKQGDLSGFDTPNVPLCPRLHNVRTSILNLEDKTLNLA